MDVPKGTVMIYELLLLFFCLCMLITLVSIHCHCCLQICAAPQNLSFNVWIFHFSRITPIILMKPLLTLMKRKNEKITWLLVYTFECGMVTHWDHDSVARVSNNFAYTVSLRYQYGRQDGGALFCASNFLKIFGFKRAQFRNDACVFLL